MKSLFILGLMSLLLLTTIKPVAAVQDYQRLTWHVPISLGSEYASQLPEKPFRAEDVYPVFGTSSIPLRMEAIRRSALYLSADEKNKLWTYLNKRRETNVNDPNLYFDVGYADVVLRTNKTGLFFLRKASERLRNPFASVAYAMAQADVDLLVENGKPDTPSIRKLDVVYKLSDAIALDVQKHQPGLWPTFVRIQQRLAMLPAYLDFSLRDYSDTYVPYGQRYAAYHSPANCLVKPVLLKGGKTNPLEPLPLFSQPVQLAAGSTAPQCLDFYPVTATQSSAGRPDSKPESPTTSPSGQHYDIKVREGQRLLGSVQSRVGVGVIEDIDHDGAYELVVRQYRVDPFNPVLVYRFDRTTLKLDPTIQRWFE